MEYGYPSPTYQTYFWKTFGIPPPFKSHEAQQAYKDNSYFFTAVNIIANEVARTDFTLVKPGKKGQKKEIEDHQALTTLRNPQENGRILSGYQLKFMLAQYLLINGENLWGMDGRIGKTGAPTILLQLNPAWMYEKLNEFNIPDKYIYRFMNSPDGTWEFDAKDIVHFKFPDPQDWYRGMSPVQPIRNTLQTYREADVLNAARLKNMAIPAGVLMTDQSPPDKEREKLQNSWQQRYGGPENAGKTPILPNGFKWQQTQLTNHDLQFMEGKNLSRDEILTNFRVGLELFGKTESKTRANAEASIFVFTRFTVLPLLEMIADSLTYHYLPNFPGTEGLVFEFDDPVPENEENKRDTAKILFENGAITPNEIREMFGLDPLNISGMDVPYTTIQTIPLSQDESLTQSEEAGGKPAAKPKPGKDEEPKDGKEKPKEPPPKG